MPVRPEKVAAVAELKEKLGQAKAVVLADNKGLTVAQATNLRRELRQAGVEFRVAKNTLIRLAAHELGIEGLDALLRGPTTLAFSYEDPVTAAKKLSEFIRKEKNLKLEVKAGLLEGRVIGAGEVKALADLPPRDQLLSLVLGGIQAPLVNMAGLLNGLLGSFAYAVDARIRQLEGA